MLGFRFYRAVYADSIQGQRSKDRIVSIYARKEENAKVCCRLRLRSLYLNMEEAIAHPDVDVVLYCPAQQRA